MTDRSHAERDTRARETVTTRRFVVKNACADCGEVLNTSTVFDNLGELRDAWMMLCLSGGLTTGSCPKGCRATFSDCNINTNLMIFDADTGEYFDMRGRRLSDLPSTRSAVPDG